MKSCQRYLCFTLCVFVIFAYAAAAPTAEAEAEAEPEARRSRNEPQFVVISEDVIPDVENTTQKVIRVNPLDLPSIQDDPSRNMDSSLYKIQSLLPAHRSYVNSKRMRKPRPQTQEKTDSSETSADTPITRYQPEAKIQKTKQQQKKKRLHFLYNQPNIDGQAVSKTMRVHVAPGAYPVYYAVARTNGRFGKFPIKGFRNEAEFAKYLVKAKIEPIERALRFDS